MRLKLLILSTLIASSYAEVKSKKGPLDLMSAPGGGDKVCELAFNVPADVVKTEGTFSLIKAPCGQGYVPTASIAIVKSAGAGGKSINLDEVDIMGWMDDPSAVFVLDQSTADDDGINMNRNFKDLVNKTEDRERTEFRNGEN